jgi:hypothetical protein
MAPLTTATANREVNRYSISILHADRAWTDINDFPCGLVTWDNKSSFSNCAANYGFAIIQTHVAATERGSTHLDQHFTEPGCRVRTIDNFYFLISWK